MSKYEVVLDIASIYMEIDAENPAEAETKAMEEVGKRYRNQYKAIDYVFHNCFEFYVGEVNKGDQ